MTSETAGRPNLFQLYQQMGEVVCEIRLLTTALRDAHDENKGRFAGLESEMRNSKHEMRNHQQLVSTHLAKVDGSLIHLETKVTALERPVKEMVALRTKVGAIGALFLSMLGVVWFFAEPVWRYVSDHALVRLFERPPL